MLRAERLLDAQDKAAQLFDEIERRAMIRAGVGEQQLSDEINAMAAKMFGVTRHWHRRIVRAGENTLQPFNEHPPDRVIAADDIVFLDFGPIFEEWEADFGRTYVLSDDPDKLASATRCHGCGRPGATTSKAIPTSPAPSCSTSPSKRPAPKVSGGAATSPAIWSGSSRTRRSPGRTPSGTSCPDRPSRCGAPTPAVGAVTGSSRSI